MRTSARVPAENGEFGAIYYSICRESIVLSSAADTAWEMIAVIIFQGLGAGKSASLLREFAIAIMKPTRDVPSTVPLNIRERENSRGVNCILGKTRAKNRGELIYREHLLLIRQGLIARCNVAEEAV